MAGHITPAILLVKVMLPHEGRAHLEIVAITGYHKAPSPRFWNGPGRPTPLIKYRNDIAKDRQMLETTGFCWEWCATAHSIQVPVISRVQSSGWTSNFGPHHQTTIFLTAGYSSRRPARCPGLTREHRRRRRQWAQVTPLWELRHCRNCVFSDDSRFKLHRSDSRIRVRCVKGRHISMLVCKNRWQCGAIHHGMGRLSLQGQERVSHCWGPHAPASLPTGVQAQSLALGKDTFHSHFALVQCTAFPHKAWATMTFLENRDVKVTNWLAKCPDMKVIEHIWDQMAIHIRDMANPPTTQERLNDAVMAVWDALRPKILRSLVTSTPRRGRTVQDGRGVHTKN